MVLVENPVGVAVTPGTHKYGVFDSSYISFRERGADEVFDTLAEAFAYIAEQIESGAEQYEVYVCKQKKNGMWRPIDSMRAVQIDARDFEPVEDM